MLLESIRREPVQACCGGVFYQFKITSLNHSFNSPQDTSKSIQQPELILRCLQGSDKEDFILGNGTDAQGMPLPGWLLDHNSASVTRRHKTLWYFRLQPKTIQQKAMRKIPKLYKTAPGLYWEEKWARVEAEYREACPEFFSDSGQMDRRIKRLTDPDIFAECSTEEEKKAALVGHVDSVKGSPIFRPTNQNGDARIGSPVMEDDEAGIWQMLVESCEKASAEKTKGKSRRTVARGIPKRTS